MPDDEVSTLFFMFVANFVLFYLNAVHISPTQVVSILIIENLSSTAI